MDVTGDLLKLEKMPVETRGQGTATLDSPPTASPASAKATADVAPWADGMPLVSPSAAFKLGRMQIVRDIRSSLPLLASDIVVAAVSLAAVLAADFLVGGPLFQVNFSVMLSVVGLVVFLQAFNGLYPGCGLNSVEEFGRCLKTCTAALAILGLVAVATALPLSLMIATALYSLGLFVMLWLSRQLIRRMLSKCGWWTQPVVLVGDYELASQWYQEIDYSRITGLRLAGIVCDSPHGYWNSHDRSDSDKSLAVGIDSLQNALLENKVSRIASVSPGAMDYAAFRGIPHVMLPTGLSSHPVVGSRLSDSGDSSLIQCRSGLTCPVSMVLKRSFDLALVVLTLPLWGAVFATIVIGLKLSADGGAIFYRQKRVGRFGVPFGALKFRSMVSDADARLGEYLKTHPEAQEEWETTHKLKDDPRVTRLGRFLRKSSLDELPQLLNVLAGQMSLVGPRPIVDCDQYDRIYIDQHAEVFDMYKMVRPGITGLWQISGRNHTSYQDRVSYDQVYLNNWSLNVDIFILWRTIKTALLREGAY